MEEKFAHLFGFLLQKERNMMPQGLVKENEAAEFLQPLCVRCRFSSNQRRRKDIGGKGENERSNPHTKYSGWPRPLPITIKTPFQEFLKRSFLYAVYSESTVKGASILSRVNRTASAVSLFSRD